MTLVSLFKEKFGFLTNFGFNYKKGTYYRIWGESILQSVSINATNHYYEFRGTISPLGCLSRANPQALKLSVETGNVFKEISLTFNGFKDFPHVDIMTSFRGKGDSIQYRFPVFYCKGKNDDLVTENFEVAANIFQEEYLPIYDSVYDFSSYFEWITLLVDSEEILFRVRGLFAPISYMTLSYKAYLDEECGYGLKYIADMHHKKIIDSFKGQFGDWEKDGIAERCRFVDKADELDPDVVDLYSITPASVQRWLENAKEAADSGYDRILEEYRIFLNGVKDCDFSWVPEKYKEEENLAITVLREHLYNL